MTNACDILTKERIQLPTGTGLRQINQIQEALARIDLSHPAHSCSDQLQELQKMPNAEIPFYIMISHNMNPELQNSFHSLVNNSAGALWIAPLTNDMELTIASDSTMQVIRWEVSLYEK